VTFRKTETVEERFWALVHRTDSVCWEWLGFRDEHGYGKFWNPPEQLAHRTSVHLSGRPLGHEQEVDHECRNRACVRPDHLKVVEFGFNGRQGSVVGGRLIGDRRLAMTHCKRNHPFSPENTIVKKSGKRHCRACHRGYYESRKAKEAQ
jgi:hypothetical protein